MAGWFIGTKRAGAWALVGVFCGNVQGAAKVHSAPATRLRLEMKDVAAAQMAVTRGVGALTLIGETLVTVDRASDRFLLTPFSLAKGLVDPTAGSSGGATQAAASSEETSVFGDSESRPFAKEVAGERRFMAVAPFVRSTLLFLESADARIIAVENPSGFFVSQRAIVLDKLKPAADPRGEPTTLEVATFRQRFMHAFGHINDGTIKLAGMAELPPKWRGGDAHQFLVASRIPGFLLMTMHCIEADLSQCRIVRGCFAEGIGDLLPEAVAGVALSSARRLVLIGDRLRHRLVVFRFDSCHDVVRVAEIALPIELKELGSVAIDTDDRLWVSTLSADDYKNANVFMWPRAAW